MRIKPLLIQAPIVIIASAVIAYGLVFWTPWFGARDDFGFGDYGSTGWWVTESVDFYPYTTVTELAKMQPEQFQALLEEMFYGFLKLSEAQLYMLSAAGDHVCRSTLIDCQGVPSENVKPFIEKALAHKQSANSTTVAQLSLAVAFAAFLISVAGFIRKMRT
jgi:hypothetical protein